MRDVNMHYSQVNLALQSSSDTTSSSSFEPPFTIHIHMSFHSGDPNNHAYYKTIDSSMHCLHQIQFNSLYLLIATGIRSPTPSEMSTGAARGTTESPKKEKILEEDESQPQTEEQGDTIKGNDAPVEEEDTREGVKESPTCPIQVKEDNSTTESEHTSSSPVSWYLQIPEEVETDDGHINIVYTSKLVKEEMVREWVNLSINNAANSNSSSST